jgi:hypothetical protein
MHLTASGAEPVPKTVLLLPPINKKAGGKPAFGLQEANLVSIA